MSKLLILLNNIADLDPYVLGLLNPDPLVRGMDPDPAPDPDPSLIKKKIVRKTLISTVLCLLCNFLSFKNDVKVGSKVPISKTT